jgi:hypothetical protein
LRLLGWHSEASTVRFSYGTSFDGRDVGMTCECFSWAVFRQLQDHDRSLAGLFAFWDRSTTASIAGNTQDRHCCTDRVEIGYSGTDYRKAASSMPNKHNAARRHHIPKMKFRVKNWAEYDAALRGRGTV